MQSLDEKIWTAFLWGIESSCTAIERADVQVELMRQGVDRHQLENTFSCLKRILHTLTEGDARHWERSKLNLL